jgi:ferric-dicitrate binding protein FerR (iron transport regulator)
MTAPVDPSMPAESAGDIELVARLLRTGGSRREPPEDAYARVYAAASAALDQKVRRRRRRRGARTLALAASMVGAAGVAAWLAWRAPANLQIATAERQLGTVALLAADQPRARPVGPGTVITMGSTIRTGPASGIALRLTGGQSLRIAAGSEVRCETSRRFELRRGAVYVDSQPVAAGLPRAAVEIVTSLAIASDVGTQFEVRLASGEVLLLVREGRVLLEHRAGQTRGQAGEQLRLTAAGAIRRGAIARDDGHWEWVQAMANAPEIDDQPLSSVLAWVSRETGRSIRYDTPDTERRAAAAILHGSIRGLEPMPALETVLATSALGYRIIDDGTILITSL